MTARKHHNDEKRKLFDYVGRRLQHLGFESSNLLDIGCGVGGDIHKWKGNFRSVLGVDVSSSALSEARKRTRQCYPQSNFQFQQVPRDVKDWVLLPSFEKVFGKRGRCTAVSCMFALPHLADSAENLEELAKLLSAILPVGGLFFGICSEGHSITEALGSQSEIGGSEYLISKVKEPESSGFGGIVDFRVFNSQYFYLRDTVAKEPLIFYQPLVDAFRRHNFEILEFSNLNTPSEVSQFYASFAFSRS